MTEARRIAIVQDEDEILVALRTRKAELQMSNDTLDEMAGLTEGHASKLLAPATPKSFGWRSFWMVLGALGLGIQIVEVKTLDDIRAQYKRMYRPRNESRAHGGVPKASSIRRVMREVGKSGMQAAARLHPMGSIGGRARWAKVPKRRRREHAIKAAVKRWERRAEAQAIADQTAAAAGAATDGSRSR